ncbi:uncharacterized protein [Miscanthus floridulus]|uniref:uncharacterized protein n=1 Tax=Miscanthus floridulus TaxID=154761 RepID=UPI003457E835
MAANDNPSYYQTAQLQRSQVRHQEHVFHLYAHQQGGSNERTILAAPARLPHHFGCTNVLDWDIHVGPDTRTGLVGWLQGLEVSAGRNTERWYLSANLVFTDQRFKGSTLSVQGPLGPPTLGDGGDWAVVGGTGEFAYAQGVATYKRIRKINRMTNVIELDIRVVCLVTSPKPEGQDDQDKEGQDNQDQKGQEGQDGQDDQDQEGQEGQEGQDGQDDQEGQEVQDGQDGQGDQDQEGQDDQDQEEQEGQEGQDDQDQEGQEGQNGQEDQEGQEGQEGQNGQEDQEGQEGQEGQDDKEDQEEEEGMKGQQGSK